MPPELLDQVLEAHGGADRFAAVREIAVDVRSWGALFLLKLHRRGIPDCECRVQTTTPHAVFSPYPEPGRRGVFTAESVRIEADDGEPVSERHDARAAFRSPRHIVHWDDLDLLYFAGYAWWNYLTAPFLLTRPGVEVREIEPRIDRGEELRRLHARFPADVPTHSAEQVFAFTPDGLLRRHDYTAEVVGGWARGAHYTHAHREFGGLIFPTRRRVLPRRPGGMALPAPTLVALDVLDVRLS